MGSDQVIMNSFSWEGTLSSSEFSVAACAFAEKWRRFNPTMPPWTWVSCQTLPWLVSHQGEGYLSLEQFCLSRSSEVDHDEVCGNGKEETCSCGFDNEELVDDATLVQNNHGELHNYDFHIVYSDSYRVPVLYFRAYSCDGQPLLLDKIKNNLPLCSSKILLESKWTFITQEEHPYLNRPWYKLHPCGTIEWMKLFLLDDGAQAKQEVSIERYLVSWLSVVGQVVGLRIPLGMLNDCNQ